MNPCTECDTNWCRAKAEGKDCPAYYYEPPRPRGVWEKKTDGVPHLVTIEWFICSECGVQKSEETPYCPNCGADMRKKAGADNEVQI